MDRYFSFNCRYTWIGFFLVLVLSDDNYYYDIFDEAIPCCQNKKLCYPILDRSLFLLCLVHLSSSFVSHLNIAFMNLRYGNKVMSEVHGYWCLPFFFFSNCGKCFFFEEQHKRGSWSERQKLILMLKRRCCRLGRAEEDERMTIFFVGKLILFLRNQVWDILLHYLWLQYWLGNPDICLFSFEFS